MEEKYREIYETLKAETQNTLESQNSNKFIEEFKQAVRDRLKEVHEKLDKKKEEIIKLTLEVYNKELTQEETPEEAEIKKRILKNKNNKKEEEVDPNTFKGKIKSLITNLDNVLVRTDGLEETIKIFKESKVNQLLEIKEGDFYFKHQRKLEYRLKGKINWDLGWSTSMNKPNNSDIDKTDEKVLNVHSNSCYNYFTTDKEIGEESVLVVFETDIVKTDGYLYFGVSSEGNNYNSNCMCCTIPQCTYIRSNGYIVETSRSTLNAALKYDKGPTITIEIRVLGKDKQVYFKVNEEEEQGPFVLPGSKFTITSGSCNSANGKIKILSALIIG